MFKPQPMTGTRVDSFLKAEIHKKWQANRPLIRRNMSLIGTGKPLEELNFIQLPIYRLGVDDILQSRCRIIDAYPNELAEGRTLEEVAHIARWISYPVYDDWTRKFVESLRDVSIEGRELYEMNQDPTRRRAFIHKPKRVRI